MYKKTTFRKSNNAEDLSRELHTNRKSLDLVETPGMGKVGQAFKKQTASTGTSRLSNLEEKKSESDCNIRDQKSFRLKIKYATESEEP